MTADALTELVELPGGTFRMGSDAHYLEEAPAFETSVAPFAIEKFHVTNAQFARFIKDSGYVTVAERPLDTAEYPQMSAAERAPGSLVFTPTSDRVDLTNWRLWWRWEQGANWRTPLGTGGPSWRDRREHPVVQVSYVDALAYAAWAGRRLLTEAEVEFATRGGLHGAEFAWGDELLPNGELMANTWQGDFPFNNLGALGWHGTAPVGTFPANGYGLYDMIGNAWQWTTSLFTADHRAAARAAISPPAGKAGRGSPEESCNCGSGSAPARTVVDQAAADAPEAWVQAIRTPDSSVRRVTKGGSHLCAPEYCQRYRPAARSPQTEDSATSHIGFRCALG